MRSIDFHDRINVVFVAENLTFSSLKVIHDNGCHVTCRFQLTYKAVEGACIVNRFTSRAENMRHTAAVMNVV